ncbi:hypothetical protein M2317_001424 [Microbacterium sp. ZKA21]
MPRALAALYNLSQVFARLYNPGRGGKGVSWISRRCERSWDAATSDCA